jgi:ankyrin repeat protein
MADVQKRLFESVNGDDVNAVKTALDQGGVINEKDEEEDTPLLIASAYNYSQTPAIVKLLLDRGANIRTRTFNGKTALGMAVSGDEINYGLVELLLSKGVDVNAQDSRGRTALMEVANKQTDQSKVIDLLLKTGAKTDIQDKRGDTALILSA